MKTMTKVELKDKVREFGFTYMFHQAMSGSQYISINGTKFRFSNHKQPSHYFFRNYTDVNSYQEIFEIISQKSFNESKFEIIEENGKKYKVFYDNQSDNFVMELI